MKSKVNRRRRSAADTRARLLDAALRCLGSGGEAAVTTISVTRGAGVAQSAFYLYFRNVDECLAEVSRQAAAQVRAAVAQARQALFQSAAALADHERFYRELFGLLDARRDVLALFVRYRTNPRALGGVMVLLRNDLCADLATDLEGRVAQLGLPRLPPGWSTMVAENLVDAFLGSAQSWLRDRRAGFEDRARVLAAMAMGGCAAVVQGLVEKGDAPPHAPASRGAVPQRGASE